MKKIYSTLSAIGCCLLSLTGMAQNSISNGNFETWKTAYYNIPEYYVASSNTQTYYHTNDSLFNCLKTTDSYHGTYAVKVITVSDVAAQDTSIGYFLSTNPNNGGNPTTWHGGVPYTQKPTGITGWYKSAVPAGDTALIIVGFSKAGSNIGFFAFKLWGTQSTYKRFTFPFTLASTPTPDSVFFGAVSSDFEEQGSGFQGIPGSMLEIDSVSFMGVASQPADFNGDFENWQNDSIVSAVDWYVQNNEGNGVTGVAQTTDAEEGKYAVELTTYLGNENNKAVAQSGQISTGYYPNNCNNNCKEEGGHAYAKQIDTLAFYYKYVPSGKDTANVNLNFLKNGQNWNTGQSLLASATYTLMEIPFNVGFIPDTAIVSFQSSEGNDTAVSFVGSILKVDGVHFKSQPLPVTPIITQVGAVLTSSDATGNQWYLNGNIIAGATGQIDSAKVSGTYTDKVTIGGVTSAISNSINFTATATPTVTVNGDVLTSSSLIGDQWYLNGAPIYGATTQTYTATQNGTYTVKVIIADVPSAASAPVVLTNVGTGIEEYPSGNSLSVYPNPSTGIFAVKSQTAISSIEVLNAIGVVVLSQQVNASTANIDLSGQAKGIYFYKVNSNNTLLGAGKMIIE